jgi:hypothetical protein
MPKRHRTIIDEDDTAAAVEITTTTTTPSYSIRVIPEYNGSSWVPRLPMVVSLPAVLGRRNLMTCWWDNCPNYCQADVPMSVPCREYCHAVRHKQHRERVSKSMVEIDTQGYMRITAKHEHLLSLEATRVCDTPVRLMIGDNLQKPWMAFSIVMMRAVTPSSTLTLSDTNRMEKSHTLRPKKLELESIQYASKKSSTRKEFTKGNVMVQTRKRKSADATKSASLKKDSNGCKTRRRYTVGIDSDDESILSVGFKTDNDVTVTCSSTTANRLPIVTPPKNHFHTLISASQKDEGVNDERIDFSSQGSATLEKTIEFDNKTHPSQSNISLKSIAKLVFCESKVSANNTRMDKSQRNDKRPLHPSPNVMLYSQSPSVSSLPHHECLVRCETNIPENGTCKGNSQKNDTSLVFSNRNELLHSQDSLVSSVPQQACLVLCEAKKPSSYSCKDASQQNDTSIVHSSPDELSHSQDSSVLSLPQQQECTPTWNEWNHTQAIMTHNERVCDHLTYADVQAWIKSAPTHSFRHAMLTLILEGNTTSDQIVWLPNLLQGTKLSVQASTTTSTM